VHGPAFITGPLYDRVFLLAARR